MMLLYAVVVRVIAEAPIYSVSAPGIIIYTLCAADNARIMQYDFFLSFERIHIHRLRNIYGLLMLWMLPDYLILLLSFDPVSATCPGPSDILSRIQLHNGVVDLYRVEKGIIDLSALWRRTRTL